MWIVNFGHIFFSPALLSVSRRHETSIFFPFAGIKHVFATFSVFKLFYKKIFQNQDIFEKFVNKNAKNSQFFNIFSISRFLKGFLAQNLFFSRLCRRFLTVISRFFGSKILVTLIVKT